VGEKESEKVGIRRKRESSKDGMGESRRDRARGIAE